MKKIFILVLLTLFFTPFISANKVSAVGVSNFDFGNISPRFQYLRNTSGSLINFDFEFYDIFDYDDEITSINLRLDQINHKGGYVKNLQYFNPKFTVTDSDFKCDVESFIAVELDGFNEKFDMSSGDLQRRVLEIQNVYIQSNRIPDTNYYVDVYGDLVIFDTYISGLNDVDVYYCYENSDDYSANITYDWSDLDFTLSNIAFYRLKYNNIIIWTGAVMRTPRASMITETINYGLEIGDFLVESDGTPSFSDQNDFTYNLIEDDYLILHYNAPELNPQLTDNDVIRFIDIESNTIEESFTLEDVFSFQGGNLGDFKDSFVPLTIDGIMIPALLTDFDHINDAYLYTEFTAGSYLPVMVYAPNSFSLTDYASTVINITDTLSFPFELNLLKKTITLNDIQRLTFRVNHVDISKAYETTEARDNGNITNYIDLLNLTPISFSVGYKPADTLVNGDEVGVHWKLKPKFLPYSIDTSEFAIELTDSYIIDDEVLDVKGNINNLFVYYGNGDETGKALISIFIVLLANMALALWLKARAFIIYAIVNSALILLASVLGFVPIWFLIGIGILIMISVIIAVNSGGGVEE